MNVYRVIEAGEEFCIIATNMDEALEDLMETYMELDFDGEVREDYTDQELLEHYTSSVLTKIEFVGEYVEL